MEFILLGIQDDKKYMIKKIFVVLAMMG